MKDIFGGTRLSGPFFSEGRACHVRRLTLDPPLPFPGGLKSRGESGAKAPHSMECGDLSLLFYEGFRDYPKTRRQPGLGAGFDVFG